MSWKNRDTVKVFISLCEIPYDYFTQNTLADVHVLVNNLLVLLMTLLVTNRWL